MIIFSVHDSASDSYLPPFCQENLRDAIDGFATVTNDESTKYSKFPADFNLVSLGQFDVRTGIIELFSEKNIIKNGAALKQTKE